MLIASLILIPSLATATTIIESKANLPYSLIEKSNEYSEDYGRHFQLKSDGNLTYFYGVTKGDKIRPFISHITYTTKGEYPLEMADINSKLLGSQLYREMSSDNRKRKKIVNKINKLYPYLTYTDAELTRDLRKLSIKEFDCGYVTRSLYNRFTVYQMCRMKPKDLDRGY